jgi:predicted ArsR family transcriptional regulator
VPVPQPEDRPPSREEEESPASAVDELRELRDPRALRALAHPIRMDLLEALALEGPLTATAAGNLIGQTATTCSFHLRQLAKYGFVEDAGNGGGRERPWRITSAGNRIPEGTGEAELDLASDTLSEVFLEREIVRVRQAFHDRHGYPSRWRDLTGFDQSVLFVTAEEMEEIRRKIGEALFAFSERIVDPSSRPAEARAVEVLLCSYLLRPDQGGE